VPTIQRPSDLGTILTASLSEKNMKDDDIKSNSVPAAATGHCKLKNRAQKQTDVPRKAPGGYEGSRFNAVRHAVLSELTVLPWEDEAEYAKLLEAFVEEYGPRGPTEDHLIEEIAGVIWRKRRLRLAEAGSYWSNLEKTTNFSLDTLETGPVPILDAIAATPAATAKNIVEVQNRIALLQAVLKILKREEAGDYEAALAELDERTQSDWQEQIAPELEDLDEDGDVEQYAADANGLVEYLECSVLPECAEQLEHLENRSLMRAQVLGEALDFGRLEPISRYEVHLDRKFERAVSMLLRLRELRQLNEAG
jgi:hypothetical protein